MPHAAAPRDVSGTSHVSDVILEEEVATIKSSERALCSSSQNRSSSSVNRHSSDDWGLPIT